MFCCNCWHHQPLIGKYVLKSDNIFCFKMNWFWSSVYSHSTRKQCSKMCGMKKRRFYRYKWLNINSLLSFFKIESRTWWASVIKATNKSLNQFKIFDIFILNLSDLDAPWHEACWFVRLTRVQLGQYTCQCIPIIWQSWTIGPSLTLIWWHTWS